MHSLTVGMKVFCRTITMAYTGRIAEITPTEMVLNDAAWIADTGRFADAMASGNFSEVEPYPAEMRVAVRIDKIVDVCLDWPYELPREQK